MTNPRAPLPAPPAGTGKLRVLALHSFRTSGAIFKQQFERARMLERLGDIVDVVFIDAPNAASGTIPKDVAPFFTGPYYEWFTVERMGDKLEFDEIKLNRSIDLITRVIREQGPFDGLIGFSQGTACASSIIALQQAGLALQDVKPLRFCILFAGFKSRYPPHAPAWQRPVSTPSLHVFGDRDELRDQCKILADAFANPVVIQHTRGHSIPTLGPHQLAVMRAFLTSFLGPRLSSPHAPTLTMQPTSSTSTAVKTTPTDTSEPPTETSTRQQESTAHGSGRAASEARGLGARPEAATPSRL